MTSSKGVTGSETVKVREVSVGTHNTVSLFNKQQKTLILALRYILLLEEILTGTQSGLVKGVQKRC